LNCDDQRIRVRPGHFACALEKLKVVFYGIRRAHPLLDPCLRINHPMTRVNIFRGSTDTVAYPATAGRAHHNESKAIAPAAGQRTARIALAAPTPRPIETAASHDGVVHWDVGP